MSKTLVKSDKRRDVSLSLGCGVSKTLPGNSPTGLTPVISGGVKRRGAKIGEKESEDFLGRWGAFEEVGVREGRGTKE